MNPNLEGYTGRVFEREVLGECRVRCQGYLKFRQAMDEVIANQPHALHDPPGEVGHFRDAVYKEMKRLGLNPNYLRLYTAVGSALDRFHGIDGFFTFEGITVTIDTTINQDKDEDSIKARVLVTGEDAVDGFKWSARRVAELFSYARSTGKKGVI